MEDLEIVTYQPEYKEDFVRLNSEWITTFFHLESSDLLALNDPEGYILNKGGQIFFALHQGKVVGCCALIPHPDDGTYELGKMAVTPKVQGLGIGYRLGLSLISYADNLGARRIFLEGNTQMEASIVLYRKLGFEVILIDEAAYERCDIKMELEL